MYVVQGIVVSRALQVLGKMEKPEVKYTKPEVYISKMAQAIFFKFGIGSFLDVFPNVLVFITGKLTKTLNSNFTSRKLVSRKNCSIDFLQTRYLKFLMSLISCALVIYQQ